MSDTSSLAQEKAQLLKKLKALWSDSRSHQKRFFIAGSVWLAACFTFLFFGPLELVVFSGDSLSFRYDQVAWLLALAALAVLILGTLALMLLRGKIFNYSVSLVFALTVCGYLQASFMNGDLGLLTGDGIDWTARAGGMLGNLAIWALVIGAVLLVMYLHRELWSKLVRIVSLILVVMQLVPTSMILLGAYDQTQGAATGEYFLSEEGMYEYSSQDNIFVFVLDRLDYDYIESALKQDSTMLDGLDGFISYTNAISAYARTRPALAHLLTGSQGTAYLVETDQFYQDVWTEDGKNILQDLTDANYEISMYTKMNYLFSDADFAARYVSNVSDGKGSLNEGTVLSKLWNLSAYRYTPTALKPFYWADTNYYNADIYKEENLKSYAFDDAGYAPGFLESTADGTKNSFKFYHFFGPHAPYTLKADGTASEEPTTVQEQTIGSFKNLTAAFQRMKDLGIYEDAAIIITADHGNPVYDSRPITKSTRIGLFYKPSGIAGTPLRESGAPVSTQNISATILKAAGADYSAYGRALDDIGEDEEITRITYKSIISTETYREIEMITYHVTGDAADFDNWHIVDRVPIENSFY